MDIANGSSTNSLTICQIFFYHNDYYCENCNLQAGHWFFIIQFQLSVQVILWSSGSIIWNAYKAIKEHQHAAPSNGASDGRSYWISCCYTGLLLGIGHTAESATLACSNGPSVWGNVISNCADHLAIEAGLMVEVVCACKLGLGTLKKNLFRSSYPSFRLVLFIWAIIPVIVVSTAVVKYRYNSIYMDILKPIQSFFELVMQTAVVVLLIGLILYTVRLMSRSCKLGTHIYLSDESKKLNRINRRRLLFHLAMLTVVIIFYILCTGYYFVAKTYDTIISQPLCMVWMVPYKLLTIMYAMGKSIVVLWELWYK